MPRYILSRDELPTSALVLLLSLSSHVHRLPFPSQGLLEDPERVRAFLLPRAASRAQRCKARERNDYGKECADGVAILSFAQRLTTNEALALDVSLDARLTASAAIVPPPACQAAAAAISAAVPATTDDSRDLIADVSLTAAAAGSPPGALLRAQLEASSLLAEWRLLIESLEHHRIHDAASLPSGGGARVSSAGQHT